jgi:hypothetical protein
MLKRILLHIPKTAGTSLREALATQFPEERICPERFDNLAAWPVEKLEQFEFFAGHFSYNTLSRIPGELSIVTMLREPRSRLLSDYYFAKSHTWDHINRNAPKLALAKRLPLSEYFKYLRREIRVVSPMVVMLGAGDLDLAKRNLENMTAVGLSESADDSLRNITWRFGLKPMLEMPRLNVTGERVSDPAFEKTPPEREELTDQTRQLIDAITEKDRILYDHAKRIFERQLRECDRKLLCAR